MSGAPKWAVLGVLKICTHESGTTRKTPFLIVVARWSPGGRLVFSGAGAGGFVVAGGFGLVVGFRPGATQALKATAVAARVMNFRVRFRIVGGT
jgi:hypothetical protein